MGRSPATNFVPVTVFSPVVLPDAEDDLRGAYRWYFDRSPLAADAFRAEALQAIDGLAQTADRWSKDSEGIHSYHLRHFPYTVFYEIDGSKAIVLAVAHQRRRPGFWRAR